MTATKKKTLKKKSSAAARKRRSSGREANGQFGQGNRWRWRPGETGNAEGRLSVLGSIRRELRNFVAHPGPCSKCGGTGKRRGGRCSVCAGSGHTSQTSAQAIAGALVKRAVSGNVAAIALCIEQIDGKPVQPLVVESKIPLEVVQAALRDAEEGKSA